MLTQDDFITWRGRSVPHAPVVPSWTCYLLHFSSRYFHAGHYIGMTGCLDARLKVHRSGGGARLLEVVTDAGIDFEVSRLWLCDSYEEARALERKLKRTHGHGPHLCPLCNPRLQTDVYTLLRQRHYPLAAHVGRRQPSPVYRNVPFERRFER